MKNLFLSIVLFLASVTAFSQVYQNGSYQRKTLPSENMYIPWKLSNDGCYGCASFYWSVTKVYDVNTTQYQYTIWFYSNSFYANGAWASTYLNGVSIFVDGISLYQQPIWLLFKETNASQLTSFYTTNGNAAIRFTYATMSIY